MSILNLFINKNHLYKKKYLSKYIIGAIYIYFLALNFTTILRFLEKVYYSDNVFNLNIKIFWLF